MNQHVTIVEVIQTISEKQTYLFRRITYERVSHRKLSPTLLHGYSFQLPAMLFYPALVAIVINSICEYCHAETINAVRNAQQWCYSKKLFIHHLFQRSPAILFVINC